MPDTPASATATGSATLTLAPRGDREILIARAFAAPRARVFAAFTSPALIRQWMVGPPGWSMPVCNVDLRPGGAWRFVWRSAEGREMGAGGTYCEIDAPARLVHIERFDQPWYPGEAVIATELAEQAGITRLALAIRYETREARDGVLAGPMQEGLGPSYDRLDALL